MRLVHECSLYSIYLEPIATNHNGGPDYKLGGATGFLYRYSGEIFLVSNYHVFSGRNALTGVPLDKEYSALPSKLKVYFLLDQIEFPTSVLEVNP